MGTIFVKIEIDAQFECFDALSVSRVEYESRGTHGTIFFCSGEGLYTTRENCQRVERALQKAAVGSIGPTDPTLSTAAKA